MRHDQAARQGWFYQCGKNVIYFVVNRFQIGRMKNIVHTIDPAAFLTISEVADVFRSVNTANAPEITEVTEDIPADAESESVK